MSIAPFDLPVVPDVYSNAAKSSSFRLTGSNSSEDVLIVNNIEVVYSHVILVLKGVSLKVKKGGITALLGGNGAGKSTTLKSISNLLASERGEVTKGSVTYSNEYIHDLDPAQLVKKGVIQVMEGRHCFEHLTVEENLLTGAYTRSNNKEVCLLYTSPSPRDVEESRMPSSA